MILPILAAANFLLGVYDTYITQRRLKVLGRGFELNNLVKWLSTRLGPQPAAAIGVLGPCVGWSYILCYFNLYVALAILVGYNLKRFELQLSSSVVEKSTLKIQKMIHEFGATKRNPPACE